jgi:hypothetical protein
VNEEVRASDFAANDDYEANADDVEKRWRDPVVFRAAAIYVVSVIAVAAVAFVATVLWHSLVAASLVPISLFVGGLGALYKTYRVWQARGTWPIWHGAAWVLLMCTLLCLGVPTSLM